MDNASIHKSARLRQLIEEAGRKLVFLPPYSPQLNPIESAFSKMKARMRRHAKPMVAAGVSDFDIVDNALSVSPEDAQNFFGKCGYSVE